MTLVELNSALLQQHQQQFVMLTLQQQQQHYGGVAHRGNVIVTAGTEKMLLPQPPQQQQQQQQQQQPSAQKRQKMYAQQQPSPYPQQPASVARRNARERNRVKQVNNGFATLRQHIPQALAQALGSNTAGTQGGARAGSKKLSKVETLRMAVEYIRNLQEVLKENDSSSTSSGSSAGSPAPQVQQLMQDQQQQQQQQQQVDHIKFELKSDSGDDECIQDLDYHHHNHHHQLHEQQYQVKQYHQVSPQPLHRQSPVYVPAPCSEASNSPTPSFVSDASSVGGGQTTYGGNFTTTNFYAPNGDGYDSYSPMSPEDEELLDYITFWPNHPQ